MPKSIGWRLTVSFAAIAFVAAVVLGAVLLVILQSYYTARELDYLTGNAQTISGAVTKFTSAQQPADQLQSQIESLAFLSQARIRIYDDKSDLIYDSGVPDATQVSLGLAQKKVDLLPKEIQTPDNFFRIITIQNEKKAIPAGPDPKSKPVLAPDDPSQNIILFKSINVVGSPFGFDLGSDADSSGVRSGQSVTQKFPGPGGALYSIELSDGPAYGRDILNSVAAGWAIASAIAILFAAGVGWFISRRISAPILALTAVTAEMAQGNLATRADAGAQDEFGQLAHSFNDMAERVETTIVMLRRFVTDAAHELGTPLTALKSNLDLAADENDAAARAQFLARAQTTVVRLETLSRDLLDLSRLEAHASQSTPTNVNLVALVERNAEVYASRAEQAGIHFDTVLPVAPIWIRADAVQVQRALANLIDNALKFTPAGGVVRVEFAQDEKRVRVLVSDTGIGIPGEDMPQLFQRFHRARNSSAYPGSGLGLALVKAIMQEQHGNVQVEPLEVGTRFILEWEHR